MTDARVTQAAVEQWMNANAQARSTQVAIQQWGLTGPVGTRAVATQLALEQWVKAAQRSKARATILA